MARKRTSLKDKNVFKRSKELGSLIGSSNPGTEGEDSMAEENKEEIVETANSEDLSALSAEADLATDDPGGLPANEAAVDFTASLSEEAAFAMTDDDLGFPPAIEGSPDEAFPAAFPAADETGLATNEAGFDPAFEGLAGDDFSGLESGVTDEFGFPPAAETPPADAGFAENMPVGESGLEYASDMPVGESGLDYAADMPVGESGLGYAEDLPIGEAGFEEAIPSTPPTEPFGGNGYTPDPFESTAPGPVDTTPAFENRPVSPPVDGPDPLPAPPVPGSESFAVSKTTPLTLGDDAPRDIFDFMGVTNEPETITYQIPTDIEELTPEERKRRVTLLKDKYIGDQFRSIYEAVDEQYQQLLDTNISSNKAITDWAQNLLAETRFILMNYQIEYLAKAEWNIEQVKARFDRAEESERWRKRWAWPIIAWGLVWFLIFIFYVFNTIRLDFILPMSEISQIDTFLNAEVFIRTILFGGIGGVTAVFYSMLKYVSERSYDKEHNVSYVVKPFMGMVIGTLVYLIIFGVARLFNLNAFTIQEASNELSGSAILTYLVALAAGFKENVAFALLSKMMKIVFRDDRDKDPLPEAPAPRGPFDHPYTVDQ